MCGAVELTSLVMWFSPAGLCNSNIDMEKVGGTGLLLPFDYNSRDVPSFVLWPHASFLKKNLFI